MYQKIKQNNNREQEKETIFRHTIQVAIYHVESYTSDKLNDFFSCWFEVYTTVL